MDARRTILDEEGASVPMCSVPGCGRLATIRRLTAEPLQWELGELEPFVAVAFLCPRHVGGLDAPEDAW